MAKKHENMFPHFDSLDALVEYVDRHDLGDYLESMPEVHFDVDIREQIHLVRLDEDIATQIEKIAFRQHIPSEVLINTWLRKKLAHVEVA